MADVGTADQAYLELQFVLRARSQALTTRDLATLASYSERLAQRVVSDAGVELTRAMEVPSSMLRRPRDGQVARARYSPLEITRIESGSVLLTTGFAVVTMIGLLTRQLFSSAIEEAWRESEANRRLKVFVRDRLFGGVAKSVDAHVANEAIGRGLQVVEVDHDGDRRIVITVEKRFSEEEAKANRLGRRLLLEEGEER